jgi:SAM-dependent methyltransferase
MHDDPLLLEQRNYYEARAAEYDEWFLRQGRYDRGESHRREWFREVGIAEAALRTALPEGDVLELACGTGLWTRHLTGNNRRVVAVDASPDAIARNRQRLRSPAVEYVLADLFSWTPPPGQFDAVVFCFWLSHVPRARFDALWELVRTALKPGGVAFFVDSLLDQASAARDQGPLDRSGVAQRRLNDGRTFRIVKIFHEPATLERELRARGWNASVHATGRFFLYGTATPRTTAG